MKKDTLMLFTESSDTKNPMDQKLIDILLTLGISANLQGYYYLKDSIKLVIQAPIVLTSITKTMYPAIAQKYDTTACRVERAIRHALDVSFNKGRMIKLNDIFGLNIFDENDRPTNSEFVALVANKLAFEM